jgi:casein kinase II subunit beta
VLPVGLSDNLRTSRFKVFCPRCEEVYMPKFKSINIDGAYFGTSLPHIFIQHYPDAIILPPKVFFYEPTIAGFKIHGKRGSTAYNPVKGAVKYIDSSMSCLEKETLNKENKSP